MSPGFELSLIEQVGAVIGDLDLQIASIALDHRAVLVTHKTKHFSRLFPLVGLTLEDWLA